MIASVSVGVYACLKDFSLFGPSHFSPLPQFSRGQKAKNASNGWKNQAVGQQLFLLNN